VALPAGLVSIRWLSDESINGAGWQFDLYQDGATAQLQLEPSEVQGSAFEVVPSYGRNELASAAVRVNVTDYDAEMPPSPAFVPEAISFVVANESAGHISGTATVRPALMLVADAVDFYQLCVAIVPGHRNETCWSNPVDSNNLSKPVLFDIPATPIPAGSLQFTARAGNAYGLGGSYALLDFATVGSKA